MRQFIVGVAAALCVVTSAASQQVVNQPPASSWPSVLEPLKLGAAIVLGRVTEAGTTSGVPAQVTLTGPALGSASAVFTNGQPGGTRTITADGEGYFVFRDLPPGAYGLTASAAGYISSNYGQSRIIQIRRTLDLIRQLEITESDRVVNAPMMVWRRAGLSGRVVDETGDPMVNIPVTVIARMTDWGGPVSQVVATVTTDDRGIYHADVTPGDYVVGVTAATTTVPAAAAAGFLNAQAEGGTALDAYMAQMIANGSLLPRGTGARVGSLMVTQFGTRNMPVVPPPTADSTGTWFYPSTFHPSNTSLASAAVVTVGSGEEKPGIDVQLRPAPARRVSGRLIGPVGPVPGLAVRLVGQDPTVMRTSPATLIDTPQALADGNGEFVFLGIAPGAYTLVTMQTPQGGAAQAAGRGGAAAPAPAAPIQWAVTPVTVGDTDVTGLQVQLQSGVTVSGRLVVEGSGATPPPQALRNIAVTPRPVPGGPAAFQTRIVPPRVDDQMRFTSAQVIPGSYQMVVTGVPGGWVLKDVVAGGQTVVDKAFTLGSGGVSDVVVSITDRITTITGIVRNAEGAPASAPTVAVFPVDRSLWRLAGMASRRVQTAAPGRDGRYTFRALPAGEYYVVAVDWPSADFSDSSVLTAVMPHATRVTIADGDARTQDLRLAVMR